MLPSDIDAELGLITCVWDRIGERFTQGFKLIPVKGVGEAAGGDKIGGNGVEGTFNKDMINDEMTEAHKQIVKPLSQTFWCAQACAARKVRVCAFGEVLSVHSLKYSTLPNLWTTFFDSSVNWKVSVFCRYEIGVFL